MERVCPCVERRWTVDAYGEKRQSALHQCGVDSLMLRSHARRARHVYPYAATGSGVYICLKAVTMLKDRRPLGWADFREEEDWSWRGQLDMGARMSARYCGLLPWKIGWRR